MSGNVEVSVGPDYVLVELSGAALPPNEIAETVTSVVAEAKRTGLDIVISREMSVKQQANTVDFFYLAKLLEELAFSGKAALVFPSETHEGELDFFVLAARNRGAKVSLFPVMAEALEWIGVEPS